MSYASFSQSQPSPNYVQPADNKIQHENSQPQDNKFDAPAPTPVNAGISKSTVTSNVPSSNTRQILAYYRPQIIQTIPQYSYTPQQQVYSEQPQHFVNANAGNQQQPFAVAPTFPRIQYFGKLAPAIFGGYQQ